MCCIRVKFELLKLLDIVGYIRFMSIVHGPKWSFYSCYCYIDVWDRLCRFCIWVELPVQRRLCPIFVKNVGSSDIDEYSAGPPGLRRHIPNPTFFFNLGILGD